MLNHKEDWQEREKRVTWDKEKGYGKQLSQMTFTKSMSGKETICKIITYRLRVHAWKKTDSLKHSFINYHSIENSYIFSFLTIFNIITVLNIKIFFLIKVNFFSKYIFRNNVNRLK